jgi:hemoglobin
MKATTLYEKLGGHEAIQSVVDDFYNRILADDTINHFFADVDMDKGNTRLDSFPMPWEDRINIQGNQ